MVENLPYGRTEISISEYKSLINTQPAVDILQQGHDSSIQTTVDEFINCVPDLLAWLAEEGRDYPWRHTMDPWRIYMTEILLQRTSADAVDDLYESFFDRFPNPEAVVEASDQEIQDLIYSLGFINHRTRSLNEAAQLCYEQYDGSVPEDLDTLKEPWRIGRYTARACLLFAYNQPFALVDTNIARIFGRVFDYDMPEQPHKSDSVYALIDAFVPSDPSVARSFTFALLDLGARICESETPLCEQCPLQSCCCYAAQ